MMNWDDWFGDGNDPGWIVIYVIVALLVIAAIVAFALKKKRDVDHRHAESMRTYARGQEPRLGQQEAETRRLEAESEQARAEADRLEAAAQEKRSRFERDRDRYVDTMHEADRIDPQAETTEGETTDGEARHRA